MLFRGEKEAIEQVLKYGEQYGYGNLIGHLKRAWIKLLMDKWGISLEAATLAADVYPYPQNYGNEKGGTT